MSGKKAKEQRARDEMAWARREVFEVRALNDRLVKERDDLMDEVDRLRSHLRRIDAEEIAKDLTGKEARHSPEANWLCKLSRVVMELDEVCDQDGDTDEAMLPMDGWEELVVLARKVHAAIHPEGKEAKP